jgi:hypothetical protein
MKAIIRRLRRLEDRLGPAIETEFARQLRERIEEGRRRVAEARERGELGPPESGPLFEARRQRLLEATASANRARLGRDSVR